jgi:hypothetical protein
MAATMPTNTSIVNNSGAQITGRVETLTHTGTDSRYSFDWTLYRRSSSDGENWSSVSSMDWLIGYYDSAGGGSNTGWAQVTFTNWTPSSYSTSDVYTYYQYYIKCEIYFSGSLAATVISPYYVEPYINPATISNISTQKTTIQFDYTNTVGNLTLMTWNGSGWATASTVHSGHYSTYGITNGTHITFTNLIPNTEYDFYVKTYIMSNSRYGGMTHVDVNTTAWPTTQSGTVSCTGRYDGGYLLTCNSHGWESSGFGYGLKVDGYTNEIYCFTSNLPWVYETNEGGMWYYTGDYRSPTPVRPSSPS